MGFARVVEVATAGSTNADVMAALGSERGRWPHLSVLVARRQTAGRGRAGRDWVTPAAGALTCSVVIGAPAGVPLTWVPLAVGLAVRRALATWLDVGLKWPNDVVAGPPHPLWGWGRKLGGILCERHPAGPVVAGIGVNCLQPPDELPVPWAGSLAALLGEGAPTPGEVLRVLGPALAEVFTAWDAHDDALRVEYAAACTTLGARIRVEVAGGTAEGVARAVDDDGALLVERPDGEIARVTAGDVVRLRGRGPDGCVGRHTRAVGLGE